MYAAICLAAACCLAPPADPLVAALDKEFRAMLEEDSNAAALRKAESLLEQTNQNSRWTNYMTAAKLLRKTRSKAAVPLLLKYMIPHSKFGSTGSVDTYAETILLLTGQDIGDPFAAAKSTTDRPAAVRAAVEKLWRDWWLPNKDKLTTDFAKWPRADLERYVDRMLKKSHSETDAPSGGAQATAYRIYHVIMYGLDRSKRPDERGWLAEELHPSMTPILLERAGYMPQPDQAARSESSSIHPGVIGILAHLRENAAAPQLDKIAGDKRQGAIARLNCALALHVAGEQFPVETPLSIWKSERRLQPRLTALMTLMLCDVDDAVGAALMDALEDRNREIRAASVYVLRRVKYADALPKLEKLLRGDQMGSYRSSVLDAIGAYRDEEAIRIAGEFLADALSEKRLADSISDALGALQDASGQRWTSAGAHDTAYYREKSQEALKWFRLRRAAIASQQSAKEYEGLLKDYNGQVTIPASLLKAYTQFVAVARKPTEERLRGLCLPDSVEITTAARKQNQEYGRSLNLPFLREGFTPGILNAAKPDENVIVLRTGTSYLRYIKTSAGDWKLYGYGDKPIE